MDPHFPQEAAWGEGSEAGSRCVREAFVRKDNSNSPLDPTPMHE